MILQLYHLSTKQDLLLLIYHYDYHTKYIGILGKWEWRCVLLNIDMYKNCMQGLIKINQVS